MSKFMKNHVIKNAHFLSHKRHCSFQPLNDHIDLITITKMRKNYSGVPHQGVTWGANGWAGEMSKVCVH